MKAILTSAEQPPSATSKNRINHLYIDFENVQEIDLDRIAGKPVTVALILGVRHKSLPVKLVKLIQKYSEQVRLVETALDGKNALDFIIAYEIGAQSQKDGAGYFHIISGDKGFDALVQHLKANGFRAARHTAFSEVPVLMNAAERVSHLASFYKANQTTRPKRQNTLASQILALFGRSLAPADIEATIQGLVAEKIISVSDKGVVDYRI